MSVTRYGIHGRSITGERVAVCVSIDANGAYVSARDYEVLENRSKRFEEALKAIAEGCSFPEDDVQRAVRDRARAALSTGEN